MRNSRRADPNWCDACWIPGQPIEDRCVDSRPNWSRSSTAPSSHRIVAKSIERTDVWTTGSTQVDTKLYVPYTPTASLLNYLMKISCLLETCFTNSSRWDSHLIMTYARVCHQQHLVDARIKVMMMFSASSRRVMWKWSRVSCSRFMNMTSSLKIISEK